MLQEEGFTNAEALRGGFQGWRAQGYLVESGLEQARGASGPCPVCGQDHAA